MARGGEGEGKYMYPGVVIYSDHLVMFGDLGELRGSLSWRKD